MPVLLYHDLPEDALLCPMLDARRMEVYAAVYDLSLIHILRSAHGDESEKYDDQNIAPTVVG